MSSELILMSRNAAWVRPLTQVDYPQWDSLVEESPQGSIFSSSTYLAILAEATGSRLKIIGCFLDEDLIGGCSLFERRNHFIGTYAVSKGPDTPFCGFVYKKTDEIKIRKKEMEYNACLNALSEYIIKEKYASISISNSPNLVDIRPFLRQDWECTIAYTYYINLEQFSCEDFSSNTKEQIRQAINEDLQYGNHFSIDSHYQLLMEEFEQRNSPPPLNKLMLQKFFDLFQLTNSGEIKTVSDSSGKLLASYFFVWDNKRAYAWNAAHSPDIHDTGPKYLLMYRTFEELQKRGLKEVNIMHANTPQSTGFATGFNPVLVPYYGVSRDSFILTLLRHFKNG